MAVLDLYGRPMRSVPDAELLERQAVASLGSVRQIQSGHPADGLTPIRLAAILREAETGDATAYLELAEQMEEKDLHYSAVLGVRKRAIRALELHVEPGDDSGAAGELAEMTRTALNSTAIRTTLIDMMDAIGKGFSVCEMLWEREGKDSVIADLDWVDPRWFEFDRENGRHLYLRNNAGPQPLGGNRFVIHVAKAKSGLAIRGGLARTVAWAWMFKNFTVKDWSIFCEAYGHPLRLGKYDTAATAPDRQTLLRAVRQIGVDMAAIIPKTMEVEIVAANATGAERLYEGKGRWWDEQISKGVLGQVATTDAIAGGHAVGKIHENVRDDIRDADAEQVAATLQRDVAGALRRVRFADHRSVPLPNIRFALPESLDPALLLQLIRDRPAGLLIATADVYRAFSLRKPEDDEEVLEDPAPPAPLPALPDPAGKEALRRQAASREEPLPPPARDSIDALIGRLIAEGDMQRAMDGEIGGLIEALRFARDMGEVGDILAAFGAGRPGPVHDLLTRSTLAARLAGEVGGAGAGLTVARIDLEPLPHREAIEYFRSKGYAHELQRFHHLDHFREDHARNWVVAKAMRDDVSRAIREEFDRAFSEGRTLAEFQQDLAPRLKEMGWWGKEVMEDPVTGEMEEVQLGSMHRLRTIFDTNMRTAHAAGHWAAIQRTKRAFPYLHYIQIERPTKRHDHARFHDGIWHVDDPIWLKIYPPNGYFCGCTVIQRTEGWMRRNGRTVSDPIDLEEEEWTHKRSGEVQMIPRGITPGFDANPGAVWLDLGESWDRMTPDLPEARRVAEKGIIEGLRLRRLA